MKMLQLVLLVGLILLTILRLLAANQSPITSEEAYLYLLSYKWDWASMSGPGGLPGIVHLLSKSFGSPSILLHGLSPIALFISTLGIYALGRSLRNAITGVWSAVAWNILPINNTLSTQASSAIFLAACWIWFLALTWGALSSRAPATARQLLSFIGAGILLAIGNLFSYWMVLVLPSFLIWIGFSDKPWQTIKHPGIYLMVAISLLGLIGPFYWNQQNAWIAFADNTLQSLFHPGPSVSIHQISYVFTTIGLLVGSTLIASFIFALCFLHHEPQAEFTFSFAIIPLISVFYTLYRGIDITIPILLSTPILLTFGISLIYKQHLAESDRFSRSLLRYGSLLLLSITAIQSITSGYQLHPARNEPDWTLLYSRIETLSKTYADQFEKPLFLIASNTRLAAILGFHDLTRQRSPDRKTFPPVFVRESQTIRSQYNLWNRYDQFFDSDQVIDPFFTEQKGLNPYLHRSALYISREPRDLLPQTIDNGFAEVTPLDHIQLPLPNGGFDDYYIYLCTDYLTAPL